MGDKTVTALDQIKNFFTPNKAGQIIVEEKTNKRVFYEREVDPNLEILNNLEKRVEELDLNVEKANKQLAPITEQIKQLRLKYGALPNKASTQATMIKTKCMEYMAEEDVLNKRIARYNQERRTVNTQAENFRLVKDAERTQQLMMDSNRAMYGTMATLDMTTVADTASDARNASKQVNRMTSLLIDPFGVTCEEVNESFSSKFDALDYTDDDAFLFEDVVTVASVGGTRTITSPSNKNALLGDDVF